MKMRQTISATEEAIVSLDVSSISRSPTIRTNCPKSPSRWPFVEGWQGKEKIRPTPASHRKMPSALAARLAEPLSERRARTPRYSSRTRMRTRSTPFAFSVLSRASPRIAPVAMSIPTSFCPGDDLSPLADEDDAPPLGVDGHLGPRKVDPESPVVTRRTATRLDLPQSVCLEDPGDGPPIKRVLGILLVEGDGEFLQSRVLGE